MNSWKIPTDAEIDRALSNLITLEQRRYFFSRLENPEWLIPFRKKGLFNNPPPAKRDEKKGTITYILWEESRYLARMAKFKPKEVADIIKSLPETDNLRIYTDLVDAILNMPPNIASGLVGQMQKWSASKLSFLLPEKLAQTTSHLARGGQTDAALKLARSLLSVIPDPRYQKTSDFSHPEAIAKFDTWEYQEILKKEFPNLVKYCGVKSLELIIAVLDEALKIDYQKASPDYDFSYTWRKSINQADYGDKDLKNILITSALETAELLLEQKQISLKELEGKLTSPQWHVFRRIFMYLVAEHSDNSPELAIRYIENKKFFDDGRIWKDYAHLLKKTFHLTPKTVRDQYIQWIESGPDIERFKTSVQKWESREAQPQEVDLYIKEWRRDKMLPIKEYLPEQYSKELQELVTSIGEPRKDTELGASWVGPTSPKSVEELKKYSIDDLIAILKNWTPPKGLMEDSYEGLSRNLAVVVENDSENFSKNIEKFRGVHKSYIYGIFDGLGKAVEKNSNVDWASLLNFIEWAIKQTDQDAKEAFSRTQWSWVRKEITRLIGVGFSEKKSTIPISEREKVFSILNLLTEDTDPTEERNMDMEPLSLSINSIRGDAMHAIVRYALWIRRSFEKQNDERSLLVGFDAMPEARLVLENHLNFKKERSYAIRAVYGQWLPWLVLIDPRWTASQIPNLFPHEDLGQYQAVWLTYLTYAHPYDNVYDVIKTEYKYSLRNLEIKLPFKYHDENIDIALTKHLMPFYWRGKLDADIAEDFWRNASSKARGFAVSFIGRSLEDTKDQIPEQILQRLKLLWESRLAAAKSSGDVAAHAEEMEAFSEWFASGKFDNDWVIDQMIEALKLSKSTPDRFEIEKLASLVESHPDKTIDVLDLILRGSLKEWSISHWRESINKILGYALDTKQQSIVERTKNLIIYLASEGYFEFRERFLKQK